MESKDWIFLLVPIIANGILLFVFQKIISAKFDRSAKKSELNLNVLAVFRDYIVAAITAMNNMQVALNQGGDASEEMNIYVDKVGKVCECYSTYKVILSSYKNEVTQLVDSLNVCINIINNRRGAFKQEEVDSLIENLNTNAKILDKLCKKCYNLVL